LKWNATLELLFRYNIHGVVSFSKLFFRPARHNRDFHIGVNSQRNSLFPLSWLCRIDRHYSYATKIPEGTHESKLPHFVWCLQKAAYY